MGICHFLKCKYIEVVLFPKGIGMDPWMRYLGENRVPDHFHLSCFCSWLRAAPGWVGGGEGQGHPAKQGREGQGGMPASPTPSHQGQDDGISETVRGR